MTNLKTKYAEKTVKPALYDRITNAGLGGMGSLVLMTMCAPGILVMSPVFFGLAFAGGALLGWSLTGSHGDDITAKADTTSKAQTAPAKKEPAL